MYVDRLNIRFKKLELTNFRGFRHAEMTFDPDKNVTVLIADNGCGKTAILDAAAEFLRFFRHESIYRAHDVQREFKAEFDPLRDVTNGTLLSIGRAVLEIEYPFMPVSLLEWMMKCVDWLNEIEAPGMNASLIFDEDELDFALLIESEDQEDVVYLLPQELRGAFEQKHLNNIDENLSDLLQGRLTEGQNAQIQVAGKNKGTWVLSPDLDPTGFASTHRGEIELKYEMNSERPDSVRFEIETCRPDNMRELIDELKKGKAFIEDFRSTVTRRSPYEKGERIDMTFPLLVYYGGSAINTKFDRKLQLPYRLGWFQPYAHALEPDRFDFAEFFSWALFTIETAPHQWDLLKEIVLDVLNPPGEEPLYKDLRVEAQELVVTKKVGEGNDQKVKLKQLSAGEKNILALVADLTKRAIQLNPHLVPEISVDEKESETREFLQPLPGIVLIDEIDLHLHPKWQRGVVNKLRNYFPLIQFVVTTHSPFVLQNLKNEEALLFILKKFDVVDANGDYKFYGREILHILYSFMGVSMNRPEEVEMLINEVSELIDENLLDEAEKKLEYLRELLTGDDSEVIRLQTFIEFLRL